jgi:hypothetical protein
VLGRWEFYKSAVCATPALHTHRGAPMQLCLLAACAAAAAAAPSYYIREGGKGPLQDRKRRRRRTRNRMTMKESTERRYIIKKHISAGS